MARIATDETVDHDQAARDLFRFADREAAIRAHDAAVHGYVAPAGPHDEDLRRVAALVELAADAGRDLVVDLPRTVVQRRGALVVYGPERRLIARPDGSVDEL